MSSRVVSASLSYPRNKVSKATVRYNFSDGCEMYLDLNISIALYALPQRLGMSNFIKCINAEIIYALTLQCIRSF